MIPDTAPPLRPLQLVWSAAIAAVAVLSAVSIYVLLRWQGEAVAARDLIFYLDAGINMAALAGGFRLQQRLAEKVHSLATTEEASLLVRRHSMGAVAVVEGSALFAGVAAMLTGEPIHLAFVVPFFAFVALFFPTSERHRRWVAAAGATKPSRP